MSKWISVKDRFPESFMTVVMVTWKIVYPMSEVPCFKIGIYNNMTQEFYEYEDFPIITKGGKRLDLNEKVTHWMPFPEPPED